MTAATSALRSAIYAALSADPALTALLGTGHIFDEPPRSAVMPYITLGESRTVDVSTDTRRMLEHTLTLHAWSMQGGHIEAEILCGTLLQALDDADLSLTGHHLVNFRFATADIRRTADGQTYQGTVRFRAVTEPL